MRTCKGIKHVLLKYSRVAQPEIQNIYSSTLKRKFSAVPNFLLSRHPDLSGTRALLISVPRLVWAFFSPLLLPKSLSGSFRRVKGSPGV